jgi:hypothetical protein
MMKTRFVFQSAVLTGVVLGLAGLGYAQEADKQSTQSASSRQQKAAVKPRKVWTDDNLGAIRSSRGNVTVAAAQNPALPVSADADAAAATPPQKQAAPTASQKGQNLALSNPKTEEEADGMIAWEQRDIDSQRQYVDHVQEQLDHAPANQKEHFQKVLAERQQILADTRREQQDLIARKKELQKKKGGDSSVAATRQP